MSTTSYNLNFTKTVRSPNWTNNIGLNVRPAVGPEPRDRLQKAIQEIRIQIIIQSLHCKMVSADIFEFSYIIGLPFVVLQVLF